jgi:hypothetical protein
MNLGDLLYILFVAVCAWLAFHWDNDGGGGKRDRLPALS